MKVLFVIQIVCILALTVLSFVKRDIKYKSFMRFLLSVLSTAISAIVVVSDKTLGALSLPLSIFTLISYVLYILSQSEKLRKGVADTILFMSKALLVILLLEAVVFNFNTYHLWAGEYEQFDLNLSDAYGVQYIFDDEAVTPSSEFDKVIIEFTDINKKIGTIYSDVDSDAYKISYSIDFADESNSSYYLRQGLVTGQIIPDIESSKYVICNFSGDVSKMNITLSVDGYATLTGLPHSISFNKDYPATFSFLRVLVFLLSAVFVFLFVKSVFMNRSVKSQMQNFKAVTALVIIVFLTLMLFMTVIESIGQNIFTLTSGNQMTQELVDAFKSGKVTLDTTPSNALLSLPNPYDWSARLENNVDYLWDHVFYEGEYYSYYGIAPVLLLFLPYNLLTGYYFPSSVATFIFASVGLVFLALTFMKIVRRYFSDTPLCMYIASLVMLICSSGIWYCLIPSNFYEIAQTSGFCFVTLGAYFMVGANVYGDGKIKPRKLMWSSVFLALAVLCRPTTAVWCVVALIFIGAGVLKIYRSKKTHKEQVSYVRYLLYALMPFVIIGAVQMIYNYIRFGSFTDFGIQYSLTINDFTKAQYHTQFAAIGFYNYLFAPCNFSADFPYVMTNISKLDVNGYYFNATKNGVGLFFRALPMFALFLAPVVLKKVKRENRTMLTVMFLSTAVVAPCVIIFSVWESGYGVRYMVDFAWQMLMCAILIIFALYRDAQHEQTRRIYRYFMLVSMFACVVVNFALTYSYIYPDNCPQAAFGLFENIARSFAIFNT